MFLSTYLYVAILSASLAFGSPTPSIVLPGIIQRAASELGINTSNLILGGEGFSGGNLSATLVPPALAEAFVNQDQDKIDQLQYAAGQDLKPIYENIIAVGARAWVQVPDESTGKLFWLSIAGQPSKPSAYMWVFPTQVKIPDTSSSDGQRFVFANVMQVGTLSRGTSILGIGTQNYQSKVASDAAAAGFIVTTISKYLPKRAAGEVAKVATKEAVFEAEEDVVDYGIATAAEATSLTGFVAVAVSGGCAILVVTFLLYVLIDVFYREYKLSITVNNWSKTNDYAVTAYQGINEVIDNQDDFKDAYLPAQQSQIVYPDGFKANNTITVTRCNYNWINSNQLAEGLTVAMEVHQNYAPGGFRFKYNLRRWKNNQINIVPSVEGTLDSYLKANNWALGDPKMLSTKMPDGTRITATTNALSGRNDRFYEFVITIGEPFIIEPVDPAEMPSSNYTSPTTAPLLKIGSKIGMPDGSQVVVQALGATSTTSNSTLSRPGTNTSHPVVVSPLLLGPTDGVATA